MSLSPIGVMCEGIQRENGVGLKVTHLCYIAEPETKVC